MSSRLKSSEQINLLLLLHIRIDLFERLLLKNTSSLFQSAEDIVIHGLFIDKLILSYIQVASY